MTEDHRAAQRHRTLKGGKIIVNDGFSSFTCTVRNLSETGALLRLPSVVGVPNVFVLALDDGRRFNCTVARRTETELGIQFS